MEYCRLTYLSQITQGTGAPTTLKGVMETHDHRTVPATVSALHLTGLHCHLQRAPRQQSAHDLVRVKFTAAKAKLHAPKQSAPATWSNPSHPHESSVSQKKLPGAIHLAPGVLFLFWLLRDRRFRPSGKDLVHASMPPPCPPPAGASFFSGISEIMASVVSSRPEIDAAFCSAVRVTLVGSMTPAFTRSSYTSVLAL